MVRPQLSSGGLPHQQPFGAFRGYVPLWLRRLLTDALAAVRAAWCARSRLQRSLFFGVVGLSASAWVGYLAAVNPDAAPPHVAAATRVAIILSLIVAGLYAKTSLLHDKMGTLLVGAGLLASVWLLNGSRGQTTFSVGVAIAGLAPTMFCFLMLAHPVGRVVGRRERLVLMVGGGVVTVGWAVLVLTSPRAPLASPLMRCGSDCPSNIFYLGSIPWLLTSVVKAIVLTAWVGLTGGTAWLLLLRARVAPQPRRGAVMPVVVAAFLMLGFFVAYLVLQATESSVTSEFGGAYVATSVLVPVAIAVGLSHERIYVAGAVADFVKTVARRPDSDPEPLMAAALGDRSLRIAYERPRAAGYVTWSGDPVAPEAEGPDRALTWIERDGRRIAAVSHDTDLRDAEPFVQAAAAAALMHLETAQLVADLRASTSELEASRVRLVESADAERRRIERDLHDTIQQQIVGLRLRLEMATEILDAEPVRGQQMLGSLGEQIDDILETLRNLARGIYPAVLHDRGLHPALKAAAQRIPLAVSVRSATIGRFSEDIEVAVYFSCLEALQNVVKHAGPNVRVTLRLWREDDELCFDVNDTGTGFDLDTVTMGTGLINMRDRIEAVGGRLEIASRAGSGTHIRGRVPVTVTIGQVD